MKHITTFLSILALACVARGAAGVNTYYAGPFVAQGNTNSYMTINRSTIVGPFAGSDMSMGVTVDYGTYLGYMAGRQTFWRTRDCVGIGSHSLENAGNLKNCIGIGAYALAGVMNKTNCVSVNGQLYMDESNDSFYLTSDATGRNGMHAPLYFQGGKLVVNADLVTVDGSYIATECGGRYNTRAFSYFVAPWGNDAAPGTSTRKPLRTIDRALELIPEGDAVTRIMLMPGRYAYPTNCQTLAFAKNYRIVGGAGPDRVTISTNATVTTSRWWVQDGKVGQVVGVSFDGFDQQDGLVGSEQRPTFYGLVLTDCRVRGQTFTWGSQVKYPFMGCTLKGCEVSGSRFLNARKRDTSGYWNTVFRACALDGCVFTNNFVGVDPSASSPSATLVHGCYVNNCLMVDTNAVWGCPISSAYVSANTYVNESTIVLQSAPAGLKVADTTSKSRVTWYNSIICYGSGTASATSADLGSNVHNCLATGYSNSQYAVGADFRGIGSCTLVGWKCGERFTTADVALAAVDMDRPVKLAYEVADGATNIVVTVGGVRLGTLTVTP